MDKNAIKKYAVWARRELIGRVSQRAMIYGITSKDRVDPNAESVNGHLLSQKEKRQRQALIRNIKETGYEQVMEEVAYTWFNRFAALRFMEVNGYLPSHIRVFTNDAGEFKPQILSEAIHLELDGLDMNKVYELENANKSEELFKYLLIVQCNALNSILPGLFQRIEDYTELLLPDYLLREGSVIEQMVTTIPEEDWTDQVQIIGWLYQFYNIEQNELVYDGSMAKAKIPKELLPAATTIFTPDWPVRYMVENSLCRLWLEGHPNDAKEFDWKYYLDEVDQEPDVQEKLAEICEENATLKPEEILVIDPCVGSGHFLCVLFDNLVQIYEDYGYTAREAAVNIVQKNLWGLDINDRAAQLAYFAVMMKARQYDRRFFNKDIQPHVYSILESNGVDRNHLNYMGRSLSDIERNNALNQMNMLLDEFIDAKEYGSILQPKEYNWALLLKFVEDIETNQQLSLMEIGLEITQAQLKLIIAQGHAMTQRYHVVITNPPYLGNSRFSPKLEHYIKKYWPDVKSDLSMVMYKHAVEDMVAPNGFVAFIATSSWMFLSSFEKLRKQVGESTTLSSLVDYGTELFEGKVGHNPIVSWIVRKQHIEFYKFIAIRLVDFCYARRSEKEPEFFSGKNRFVAQQDNFSKVPGTPVAYWASNAILKTFEEAPPAKAYADFRHGMSTSDNNRFLRLWFEPSNNNIGWNTKSKTETKDYKWYQYLKGGEYRKWYGNYYYVVNWKNDGQEIKEVSNIKYPYLKGNLDFVLGGQMHFFHRGYTWSSLSAGSFGMRKFDVGFLFDAKGQCFFIEDEMVGDTMLAFYNSKVSTIYCALMSPTLDYNSGVLSRFPFFNCRAETIRPIVQECVQISRKDWDSFEISWDFKRHPLIDMLPKGGVFSERGTIDLAKCYMLWESECEERFNKLKTNEEELNRIFIDIYGLQNELTPDVEEKDITVRRSDLKRDIKSLISYAVGCMFGRYSIDTCGLIYAGGEWDDSKYRTIIPDSDGIIPICDDEYFEDDIVGRFVDFIRVVFGKDSLEDNLRFIADALGGKGTSRQVIRNYFINGFYADHLKVYQKRPIYWLFDSGKKNGFKCLIYMHRYQPDTIARIRTDYVHEQQSRYRTAIADLEQRINGASTSERVKLSKQMAKIQAQAEELQVYEEKIHHLADQMIKIDLDDGVKHNYEIFKDVLAKIK